MFVKSTILLNSNSWRNVRYAKSQIFRHCSTEEKVTKIKQKIGFIGDGNMSKAICKSIACKGLVSYSQVYVSSPYVANLDTWKILGANVTTDNGEVAAISDIIFLAVKPQIIADAIKEMSEGQYADKIKNKLFISVLAGLTLEILEKMLSVFPGSRLIRTMPNTPMLVGEGCTIYCPGTAATEDDLELIDKLLKVTGVCEMLPERMINAFGAVSACGPAYVYTFIEALADGAVRMGIHREAATKCAAQTVLGAAKMVLTTEKHTGKLKDEVCSAGGTTIAGIHEIERGAVRAGVMNAVEAATKRADEIGGK